MEILGNEEFEKVLIGFCISELHEGLRGRILRHVKTPDFAFLRHGKVYQSISELLEQNAPINIMTVFNSNRELFNNDVGNVLAYTDNLPVIIGDGSSEIDYYIQQVLDLSDKRKILNLAQSLIKVGSDSSVSAKTLRDMLYTPIESRQVSRVKSAKDLANTFLDNFERALKDPNSIRGVPYALKCLNQHTLGMESAQLIYVAGRPGMGKSAFMKTNAIYTARNGFKTLYITIEIGTRSLSTNIMAQYSAIDSRRLKVAQVNEKEIQRVYKTAGDFSNIPFYAVTGSVNVLNIKSYVDEVSPDCVFVDYVGLIDPNETDMQRHNRQVAVSNISNALKRYAVDFDIPFMVGAQINRNNENRADKRPQLSDLRESGSIEQDADVVIFLHRDSYYNATTVEPDICESEIIVAKNREGVTYVPMTARFNKPMNVFYD